MSETYCAGPLLRVWIPKSNGGQRPLGIPAIRDRVAQMALLLVIGPIFEADLCPEQYGFRPGVDAKMAIRRAYFHVTERGLREVVDADLSGYFKSVSFSLCLSRYEMAPPSAELGSTNRSSNYRVSQARSSCMVEPLSAWWKCKRASGDSFRSRASASFS